MISHDLAAISPLISPRSPPSPQVTDDTFLQEYSVQLFSNTSLALTIDFASVTTAPLSL